MLRNPLVLLLATLATMSIATGDLRAAIVMGLMIVLDVTLRFVQETRTESLPVENHDVAETAATRSTGSELDRANLCFLGTSVQSGTATAVAVTTGTKTFFLWRHGSPAELTPCRGGTRTIVVRQVSTTAAPRACDACASAPAPRTRRDYTATRSPER